MAKSKRSPITAPRVGEWAFLVGLLLAIVLGLFPMALKASTTLAVLVVLGFIVGLVNVVKKETDGFLIASIALLAAGTAGYGVLPGIGTYLGAILTNIASFVAPAAVIVAIRAIYQLARKN